MRSRIQDLASELDEAKQTAQSLKQELFETKAAVRKHQDTNQQGASAPKETVQRKIAKGRVPRDPAQ